MHYVLLIGEEFASVVTPIQATTSSEGNLVVPHEETQSESKLIFVDKETIIHIPPRDRMLGEITYNIDLWLI